MKVVLILSCDIRSLRKAAGLTQDELAERVGVCQSAVAVWESGNGFPTADKLPQIAKILGCTIDDLFGRTEESEV